jgi:uncharacterized delta-60 repeat protein
MRKRLGVVVLSIGVGCAAIGGAQALAAAGDLDFSYGTGGTRLSNVEGGVIRDLAIQGDGKVVAAGIGNTEGTDDESGILTRYTTAGNVDVGGPFGTIGFVDTQLVPPFAAGTVAEFDAVALDSSGRPIVAGSIDPPAASPEQMLLTRYTTAGVLDTTFSTGSDGFEVLTPSSGSDSFTRDIAIATNGDIFVAGRTSQPLDEINTVVAKYNGSGTLQTASFGGGGFRNANTSTAAAGDDVANAVAVDPANGEIVTVGTADIGSDGGATESDLAVMRFTTAGANDPDFGGGDGIVRIDVEATDTPVGAQEDDQGNDVTILPDGRILVTGTRIDGGNIDHFVMRLEADGDLDPTFGDGGDGVTVGTGSANFGNALLRLPDGRIVVAGDRVGTGDMMAVRYTAGGLRDTTFGGDGEANVDFGISAGAESVVAQPDGSLILGGNAGDNFAVARLQPDPPPVVVTPPANNPPATPPVQNTKPKKKRKKKKRKKGK